MTQSIFGDERLDVVRLAIEDSAVDDASNLGDDSDLTTIVSRRTRLIQRKTADAADAIEYEYRDAEYEYVHEHEKNRMTESSAAIHRSHEAGQIYLRKKTICRPGQILDDVRVLCRTFCGFALTMGHAIHWLTPTATCCRGSAAVDSSQSVQSVSSVVRCRRCVVQ